MPLLGELADLADDLIVRQIGFSKSLSVDSLKSCPRGHSSRPRSARSL